MSRKLTLDDIADARAHERGRVDYRTTIIELKKRRRVGVGPIITFVFENRETMRFQIQEMARAEKILSDGAIQAELDVYNPLIPEPGTLSASMFIELTSEPELRSWLPKLVGVEGGPVIGLPGASDGARREVWAAVEARHQAQLSRDDITAAVHYVRFEFSAPEVDAFAAGPVELAVDHQNYPIRDEAQTGHRRRTTHRSTALIWGDRAKAGGLTKRVTNPFPSP